MALAPSFVLFDVPSSLLRNSSTFACSLTSRFSLIRAGAMVSLTLATALETPAHDQCFYPRAPGAKLTLAAPL